MRKILVNEELLIRLISDSSDLEKDTGGSYPLEVLEALFFAMRRDPEDSFEWEKSWADDTGTVDLTELT